MILTLLLARDPMAVELAYDRWAPILYSMEFMITYNKDAAERSLLDAYLEMWRRPELAQSHRGSLLRYLGGLVIAAAHAVTCDS